MREVSIKPFILVDRTCVLHIMDMLNTSPWYLGMPECQLSWSWGIENLTLVNATTQKELCSHHYWDYIYCLYLLPAVIFSGLELLDASLYLIHLLPFHHYLSTQCVKSFPPSLFQRSFCVITYLCLIQFLGFKHQSHPSWQLIQSHHHDLRNSTSAKRGTLSYPLPEPTCSSGIPFVIRILKALS